MSHSDFAFAKNDQENDSNEQTSAQHARDQQSENEMSDTPCQLVQLAKNQFNINRKVVLKNVTGTYNDVKKFLGERYKVKNILVSKKQRHAVVWLQDGSQAEEIVETFNGKPFLGFPAEVALYKNENFLCVAHLPLNIDDEDFLGIVSELGVTERVFLMRDNEGKSKGYGFVEYSHNYEKTKLACSLLDNKRMGSCQLHCEFLKGTMLTFEALNSTCLLVDHLPPGYNNNKEFELLFAKPNEPIYCKLAFDNGHPLGFGIVEYDDYKKTEEAIKLVHGKAIDKFTIRVTYCLPGLSAIDAYEHHAKGLHDAGLLPNPKGNISLLGNPLSGEGLLDIPVDAVTDPAVKAILASNPEVLGKFQYVMSKLQNQQALQQKLGKPGVHGATPGMEDNPLLNPQLQVSILACLLAKELQDNQPDMLDNPMVMQYLKDKTNGDSGEDKLSLLGNPLLSQASHMLDSITHETSNEGPKNENEIQQLMKTTERCTPIPAEFKDFNSLLSAATGKPIKKEAEQSLDAGSLPGNINPMLALMIETQIKQQLQMVHAFSLIQTLTSGATGGSAGPQKLGLLGNAPPGFTPEGPHMGVSGAPGPQGNRRAALLGDGPPGMNIDPGNFGGHGRRGTHNQDTEDENRTQGVKRKNSHDSGPEDYPANSAQDQRGLGIPPEGAHQMYQMYQQYLQQFTKFMQKQKTEKSPSDEDDNSSAAYCSGIASKPAFSDDPNHWGQSEPYSNLGDNPLLNPAILAAAAALNPALLSSQGPPNIVNPIGNQINPLQPHQHQNDRPNQKGYRFDNASMANNPNSRSFNFGNPTASNTRSFGNPNLQEAFRSNSRQGLSSQFGVNQKGYHFENPSSANNPNSQNFNFSNPSGSNTRNFGNPNQHKSFTSNERQGSSSQFGVNQNQKPPFNQNHNPGSNRQEGFSNRNTFNSFSQTPHNNQPQQQGSIHQEYNPVKQPLSFNQRQVPNTPQEYQNQRIAPTIPQGFNQPPSQPDSYSTRGSQLYDPSHPTPANSFNYGQKPKSDLPHSWSQNDRWSTGQISAIGTKPSSMNIQNHRMSQQYQGNQYDPHSTETPRVRHGRVENNSRISPIGTLTLGYPKINFQVTNNTSYTDLLVNVQEVIASARGLETKNTRNESAFEISKEKAFQAATPNIRNLKRSTLLPSPEPSPEGNYVGQHSQGLGGHYATSYLKRRKLHHYD